eukprot:1567413-Alexandrium_andersonii.AAC.1
MCVCCVCARKAEAAASPRKSPTVGGSSSAKCPSPASTSSVVGNTITLWVMGVVRATFASDKSYLRRKDPSSGRWVHIVSMYERNDPDHKMFPRRLLALAARTD